MRSQAAAADSQSKAKSENDASEKETSEGANDATPRTIRQTIRDVFIEQQLEWHANETQVKRENCMNLQSNRRSNDQ